MRRVNIHQGIIATVYKITNEQYTSVGSGAG